RSGSRVHRRGGRVRRTLRLTAQPSRRAGPAGRLPQRLQHELSGHADPLGRRRRFHGRSHRTGTMQTDTLIEGMNALGYKVANLSQRELSHGYDFFLERRKKARFEFISANVVWQDTGEPVASPTTVVRVTLRDGAKAKEVRIGFIGLTRNDPAFQKEGPAGRRIVTVDAFAAAEKRVPALRQKADIVVALVALGLEEARQLPKRVKDIDLVVGADSAPG